MSEQHAPIPVFVMSYNDLMSLRLCLRALVRRTRRACRIVVVDNASTDRLLCRFLDRLAAWTNIEVVRNRRNRWVLGLNRAVRQWSRQSARDALFAVTDCDIVVPPPRAGACWLTRLEQAMVQNACIGKLGLSLDLGYIKSREAYRHTYERERFFMDGPSIGDFIVAPVDTTLALYRKSMFVSDEPLFIPTHQGLYRPYLYCCRTPQDFQARHLSWRFYGARSEEDVASKLICFGIVGATVVPAVYSGAPLHARAFYSSVRPLARLFWGAVAALLQARYFLRTFPRRGNQLQASRRA